MDNMIKQAVRVVHEVQALNPQLHLCGSVVLMALGLLDLRSASDIDFVITESDLDNLTGISNFREDKYVGNNDYRSFHGKFHYENSRFNINVLVFEDDYQINSEIVPLEGKLVIIQKLDDVLLWKKKYGRPKDLKDLENVAAKAVDKIFLDSDS